MNPSPSSGHICSLKGSARLSHGARVTFWAQYRGWDQHYLYNFLIVSALAKFPYCSRLLHVFNDRKSYVYLLEKNETKHLLGFEPAILRRETFQLYQFISDLRDILATALDIPSKLRQRLLLPPPALPSTVSVPLHVYDYPIHRLMRSNGWPRHTCTIRP